MPSNPNVTLSQPQDPFIGESFDFNISFDNDGNATGFGPFVVLFLDKTGTDGSGAAIDDGLTFNSASYLGSPITTTEIDLSGSTTETITVHGGDYDVTVPAEFEAGDSLVVFELPFGSFVESQPEANISVTVDSSDLADLNQPLNIETQGGFIFGDSQTGTPGTDTIIGNTQTASVEPQLVTLEKRYLGPEDETATGPNFTQQYEVVVNIAPGQTITDLDVTDILPDTMQFVDVVSIVDADGNVIAPARINNDPSYFITPDDGGLDSIGTPENDIGGDGQPTVGGTVSRRIDSVEGTGSRDVVMTIEFFVPRLDVDGDVIINANTGDDIFDQNQSELGNNAGDGNSWIPIDSPRDDNAEVYIPPTINDATPDPTDPADTGGQTDTGFTGYSSDDDGGDEFNNPDEILEEQSIAIQKNVTNFSNPGEDFTPGTVLEYTLEFQVSDYFAFEDVSVEDIFSDGQRFDDSFIPTLSFNEHGNNDSGMEFSFTGYNQVGNTGTGGESNNNATDFLVIDETDIGNNIGGGNNVEDGTQGRTKLTFKVSDLLNSTNATTGQDNQLVGGGVPDGGFNDGGATLNNNPPLNTGFGGTTGTIKFRTIVQDTYSDNYPSGDPSVDSEDVLSNNATIDGAVLNVDNLTANGNREEDDTSESLRIASGSLHKSIYAINGDVFTGADTDIEPSDGVLGYTSGIEVDPGDEITYRLTYDLPVSDFEQLKIEDFFPIPAYDVDELDGLVFDTSLTNLSAVPAAGTSKFGPAYNFDKDPNLFNLSFDANANSFLYDFGNYDEPTNQRAIIDILVTATIQDEPVADGLLFTNQVNQSQQNTFNEPIDKDAIVQINLRQPDVGITKEVVGNSTDLEAGDIVSFQITLENTGSSEKGAFDATIQDNLPTGFKIPASGINLDIKYGDGTTVNSNGNSLTFSSSANDTDGIEIQLNDDPGATGSPTDDLGAIEGVNSTDKNTVIITYDLEVTDSLSSVYTGNSSTIENTATVTYSNTEVNSEGGESQSFPEKTDSATVEVAKPEIEKAFITTSEPSTEDTTTTNSVNDVAIGEVVRYRLIAELPEGQTENLILRDNLPDGLTFLNDGTAQYAFLSDTTFIIDEPSGSTIDLKGGLGIVPVNASVGPDAVSSLINFNALGDQNVASDSSITQNNDNYPSGGEVFFKLASPNNVDRDTNSEYVLVEFNVLVDNNTVNNVGSDLNNSATVLSSDSTDTLIEHDTSNSIPVNVVEPNITVDKQVEDPDNPGSFIDTTTASFVQADTGDDVTFQVTFNNANGDNNTTAFDVVFTDSLPAGLNLTSIDSITVNDGNGATGSATVGGNTTIGDVIIQDNSDISTENIRLEIDQMPKNAEITITYSANITSLVNPEQLIVNTADVEYTSLPIDGTPNSSTDNETGSDTPQLGSVNSGDPTGERNGNGTAANNYTNTDDGHVKAPPIEPTKSIVTTSEISTEETDDGISNPRDVTIGEVVRYRLQAEIPEGNIPDFQIQDLLPDGIRYLNDGTTNISFVSDGGVSSSGETYSGDINTAAASNSTLPADAISGDGAKVISEKYFTNSVI